MEACLTCSEELLQVSQLATAASCALELQAALWEELNQAGLCPWQSKGVVCALCFMLLLYRGLEFMTKKYNHQCKGIQLNS